MNLRVHFGDTNHTLIRSHFNAGYKLDVIPEEIDVHLALSLFERSRLHMVRREFREAIDVLEQAFSLFQEDLVFDVRTGPLLNEWLKFLREALGDAVSRYYRAALAVGYHHEIAAPVYQAWRNTPEREDVAAVALLTLARCGRWQEALDLYSQLREVLLEANGADPGPQVLELHAMLLRKDPRIVTDIVELATK